MSKQVRFGEGEVATEAAAPPERKRQRLRKRSAGGPLEIPREMIPHGVDLMWVADAILGQPNPQGRMQFEINAWEPVLPEMFDGRFKGMFMPKDHRGEIKVDGMVLMWRPLELTIEARQEDIAAARHATAAEVANAQRGTIPGLDPGFADTTSRAARANTRVVRTIEPGGEIPR